MLEKEEEEDEVENREQDGGLKKKRRKREEVEPHVLLGGWDGWLTSEREEGGRRGGKCV